MTNCISDFSIEGGSFGPCPDCGSEEAHVRITSTTESVPVLSAKEEATARGFIREGRDLGFRWGQKLLATLDAERAAAAARIEAGIKAMRDREQDLRWCNKDDECHTKAEGVALAIDDFEQAIGGES